MTCLSLYLAGTSASHFVQNGNRGRAQQQATQSANMYMMYDPVVQNGKQTCTSAMDCESPCNSQSNLYQHQQQHQQQQRHASSSRKAAWGLASSSSSSLTSPPRSISPPSFGLPSNAHVSSSQRATRSSNNGPLSSSVSVNHLLMLDPSMPASGMMAGKNSSTTYTGRSGHPNAPSSTQ